LERSFHAIPQTVLHRREHTIGAQDAADALDPSNHSASGAVGVIEKGLALGKFSIL
jgi:hypothetical protein